MDSVTYLNAKQIPLDLGTRKAFGRSDFQIGSSNVDAVGWLDRWPEWPAPVLILQGAPASGKSHLAAVWQDMTGASAIHPEDLTTKTAEEIFNQGAPLLLDGLDPWLGDRASETALFHLYNMLKENQSTMMMTMRMPPSRIDFVVADLASRLRAAPSVSIHAPDDALLSSILLKLFKDRQLRVNEDVITYLLPRMERSFAAARDIVARADQLALAEKRSISVPLMRQVLTAMQDY